LSIPTTDFLGKLDVEQMQTLTLEVTMQDQSNLPVSARDTIDLHPAAYYIGVLPEAWSVAAGTEIGFSILTVDWTGAASGNHTLVASFGQYDLIQTGTDPMTGTPTYTPRSRQYRARIFRPTLQGGHGSALRRLIPALICWMYAAVTCGDAMAGVGERRGDGFLVGSARSTPGIGADAKQYQAGQTAHVLIPNPLNNGAIALITVERAKVMDSQVVTLSGSTMTWHCR